jgi:hypothetical protein
MRSIIGWAIQNIEVKIIPIEIMKIIIPHSGCRNTLSSFNEFLSGVLDRE